MIYLGVATTFSPAALGQEFCKKCAAQTEHMLLVGDKKAKLEFLITVAKWQSCYLVCVPCSNRPKPRGHTQKNWNRGLRKHISKDAARAFANQPALNN